MRREIILSKISQTGKVKDHMISLICGEEHWKQHINQEEKQKLIGTDNSMVVTPEKGGG